MSTIDEIFATISDEDLQSSIDELLVIDPTTRQISLPSSELIFGVESDTHSERKYFLCPRYVGNNVDLASCFIRVNYRNANGQTDFYLVDDVVVNGDSVVFSWELHKKATLYKGQVHFVVCVYRADNLEWNTTLTSGVVLEGLEPDIDGIVLETGDAVAQLINMVSAQTEAVKAEGATQIAAVNASAEATESRILNEIEAKGTNTLASIPIDYTALGEAVGALERMAAPGIVCEAEGTSIVVEDASNSPVQNLRIFGRSTQDGTPTPEAPVEIQSVENPKVTVAGKNLIAPDKVDKTKNGFVQKYNADDGSITISGAAEANVDTVFHLKDMDRHPFLNGGTAYSLKVYKDGVSVPFGIKQVFVDGDVTWGWKQVEVRDRRITQIYVQKTPSVGDTSMCGTYRIQLEVGTEPTEYEPYKTPQTLETTHTLHGIPVTSGGNYTDSNGQQWICDEIDLERGVYVRRVGSAVFTGSDGKEIALSTTLTQSPATNTRFDFFDQNVKNVKIQSTNARQDILCNYTIPAEKANYNGAWLNEIGVFYGRISIPKDVASTVEELKALLRIVPIVFAFPLATPIETPLTEAEIASFKVLHTNKPHTTVLNDHSAHMELSYVADTKTYIDRKIEAILG